MNSSKISRKTGLRALGSFIPLPYFASLNGDEKESQHNERLVCVCTEYGFNRGSIIPEKTGELSFNEYSRPLEKHKNELSLFAGLDHPKVGGGHAVTATMLNGVKREQTLNDMTKMESFDVKLAKKFGGETRFPLLCCGNGSPVSYNTRGIAFPKSPSAERLYSTLFEMEGKNEIAYKKALYSDNKSILDAILSDAKNLQKKLNTQDNQKLDEYFHSVRDIELKIKSRRSWIDIPKPKVKINPFQSDNELAHEYQLFYEVMALALQTESSKFITFQMGGGNGFLPVEGVDTSYHKLTHHGHREERLRQLRLIDQWRYKHLSHFISLLKKYKDSMGQPLLDTTAIVFGSGMADASGHSSVNNTVLLVGGAFKHGQFHKVPDGKEGRADTSYSNLLVTVQNSFGIEKDHFSSSNGNLNHLLT